VRKAMTILSVVALGLASSAWAGEKKDDKDSKDSKVARAMAVAQIDFDLHRAQLGPVGSTLLSEGHAKPETARPAVVAKPPADVTAAPVEAPAVPPAIAEPRQ
jgi:hypothetical protein